MGSRLRKNLLDFGVDLCYFFLGWKRELCIQASCQQSKHVTCGCSISCLQFGSCHVGHGNQCWLMQRQGRWPVCASFGMDQLWLCLGLFRFVLSWQQICHRKVSYLEPWTMARMLNETGFRAVLNYATWIVLAWMPQFHTLALNQCWETDRHFQKPKTGRRYETSLLPKGVRDKLNRGLLLELIYATCFV